MPHIWIIGRDGIPVSVGHGRTAQVTDEELEDIDHLPESILVSDQTPEKMKCIVKGILKCLRKDDD